MNSTHKSRIIKQTFRLWKNNILILLLAFGLSGVIAIAGANPDCANVKLGVFGTILEKWVLRLNGINLILAIGGIVYLLIGLLFYFTGQKLKFREIQRRIFQPFVVPTLFVVAGYFLGIAAPLMGSIEYGVSLVIAISVLGLATAIASIYEIFEHQPEPAMKSQK